MKNVKPLVITLIVAVVLIFGAVNSYNGLVRLESRVKNAHATVETTLQRRYDLIPNVVESVKGYMEHESDVFKSIADARAKIGSGVTGDELEQAESELTSAISRLLVLTENYPELKADASVNKLIVELEGAENRILVARKDYNDVATTYNMTLRQLPTVLYAGALGFEQVDLFEATPSAQEAPKVDLSN